MHEELETFRGIDLRCAAHGERVAKHREPLDRNVDNTERGSKMMAEQVAGWSRSRGSRLPRFLQRVYS